MSQELIHRPDVRVAPISKSFDEMLRVAETLLKSGFLPYSIKTPAQAVAIILMGREVGLPEMQALRSINIIQGKPTLSSELMLALFSSRVNGESKVIKSDETECVIEFKRPGREPHTQRFTLDQAKRLGFVTKDNYQKQPATMLQWRCVSAGLRFYAPDALAGISYTPDELGAAVNQETGEVIDLSLAREVTEAPEATPPDDVPAIDLRADVPPPTLPLGQGEIGRPEPTRTNSEAVSGPPKKDVPFYREMDRIQGRLVAALGEKDGMTAYYSVLGLNGFEHRSEITKREDKTRVYKDLREVAEKAEAGKHPAPQGEQGELV